MIDVWVPVGSVAALAAVFVTLVIFLIQGSGAKKGRLANARHAAISEVLSTMEKSIRMQRRPFILRFWSKPELDYALTVPRLLHELGPDENAVASWISWQVQRMTIATSDSASVRIGIDMTARLVDWGKGTKSVEWFKEQSPRPLVPADMNVPLLNRVRRTGSQMVSGVITGVAIAPFLVLGVLIVRELEHFRTEIDRPVRRARR